MDRNNLIAFALSMLVFAAYLAYEGSQRSADVQTHPPTPAVAEAPTGETAAREDRSTSTVAMQDDPSAEQAPGVDASAAEPTGRASGEVAEGEPEAAPSSLEGPRSIPLSVHTLANGDVVARISNGPELIESWKLARYDERVGAESSPIDLVEAGSGTLATRLSGIPGGFENARFEVVHAGPREIVQRAVSDSGVLMRTLRLDASGYGFDLELAFDAALTEPTPVRFELLWSAQASTRPDFREVNLLAYGQQGGVSRELAAGIGQPGFLGMGGSPDGKERIEGAAQWAGFDATYFVGVVMDASARDRFDVVFEAVEPRVSARARMTLPSVDVPIGGSVQENLRGFFGPKQPEALASVSPSLAHSVNRGWSWLEPLTRFFELALDRLYGFIPNYGLAIIVLTVIVRLVTAPLMQKQMASAERMRAVQPRLKEIQDRYKDDRQRQSEEMMKLYKQEGVNPLAGCLPVLLQFPVLVGLFYALRSSIGLRHAPFVSWIDDLSQPDLLFALPGADLPVRLLPLLMGATMYVQQKMTPTTGMDPAQARMMLIMMPAMMLAISYTFPSGLVLYWTVSNLLGIAQQYWIRRQIQPQS